jgi:hypothetical protein
VLGVRVVRIDPAAAVSPLEGFELMEKELIAVRRLSSPRCRRSLVRCIASRWKTLDKLQNLHIARKGPRPLREDLGGATFRHGELRLCFKTKGG